MNKKIILLLLTVLMVCGVVSAQAAGEPSVSITADTTAGTASLTVNFSAAVFDPFEGKYPKTYEWYFDDNTASTKKEPSHTFTAGKIYNVICKVTFWQTPKVVVQDTILINVIDHWVAAVCTVDKHKDRQQITVDGSGGAFIAWVDSRKVNDDLFYYMIYKLYAQKLNSKGEIQWATNGLRTCTAVGSQRDPQIISDSAGGVIVAWKDASVGHYYDIYTQRLDKDGSTGRSLEVLISADSNSGTAPLDVKFTSKVSEDTGATFTYRWNFGDGAISAEANPSHIFNTVGTFNVTCTVTDTSNPCLTGQDAIEINVTDFWPAAVCTAEESQISRLPLMAQKRKFSKPIKKKTVSVFESTSL